MNRQESDSPGKKHLSDVLRETSRFFEATPYCLSIIWRHEPGLLSILAISTIIAGVSPALSLWVMRYFMDAVVGAYEQHGQGESLHKAIGFCMLQIVVSVSLGVFFKGVSYLRSLLSSRLSLSLQADLIDGMACLEMHEYDNPETYNMISRAYGEAQTNKPLTIVSGVCTIISSTCTWLTLSLVLFTFSPVVVVAMFALCIPYFILNLYFGKAHFNLQYGRVHEQRVAGYLSSCFTNRRCLPEVIALDLWSFLRNKWHGLATTFLRQDMALLKRRSIAEVVITLLTYSARGGVSVYILIKCVMRSAEFTIGQLMMYVQAFSGGVSALTQVMQQLSTVYECTCFLQNYQTFHEMRKTVRSEKSTGRKTTDLIHAIELRDVSFSYPGSSRFALHDINLAFHRGQRTLLVGSNGAGKTTLARLIVGLYKPTHGQIFVNGYDMEEYDLPLLRKNMSIIFQDFVRYALTAEENIGLGSVEHITDRQRIIHSAKAAQLHDILVRLPNGYATMLGKEFRDGQDLSLGEWQRVCLARLFMRDASLTVFDEPSASLDVETESELLREISSSARDKICILISHRMLRSDIADRIVVVEAGRIVEQGNHSVLVNHGGRYAHLWNTYHRLANKKANDDLNNVVRESSAEVSRT